MTNHYGRKIFAGALLATAPLAITPSWADDVRLSGVEEYTVYYTLEGMQSGTLVEHSRNWGHSRVEITDTSTTVMGMTMATNQRSIFEDAWITTIDFSTNTATRIQNPMYGPIIQNMDGADPMEVGAAMLQAMGGQATGESESYAGESCNVWEIANLGQRMCITNDGLTLRIESNLMGMSMTRTATSVERGNPGPDDAYQVPAGISVTTVAF